MSPFPTLPPDAGLIVWAHFQTGSRQPARWTGTSWEIADGEGAWRDMEYLRGVSSPLDWTPLLVAPN